MKYKYDDECFKNRQDAIDIRNLTKYTQTILNKFISIFKLMAQEKKIISIQNRRLEVNNNVRHNN